MGNGSAPLQPLEVNDASDRLAYLALTDPKKRPRQQHIGDNHIRVEFGIDVQMSHTPGGKGQQDDSIVKATSAPATALNSDFKRVLPLHFRKYDAVGPEQVTMKTLLKKFAAYQGRKTFRSVHIG